MKPGIELDTLIAQKVLRWKWDTDSPCAVPFSTDIEYAYKLIPFLDENWGHPWALVSEQGSWEVYEYPSDVTDYMPTVTGDTLPHALCLAALKAVGIKVVDSTGGL